MIRAFLRGLWAELVAAAVERPVPQPCTTFVPVPDVGAWSADVCATCGQAAADHANRSTPWACPECGPVWRCDEDGCCLTCGADIVDTTEAPRGDA